MVRWSRRAGVRADRVVAALGGLYVAAAVGRALSGAAAGQPLENVLFDFVQIAGPGVALLYGGLRLPRTGIHADAYSRVLRWCLGTAAALVGVVALLVLDPGLTVNQPGWSTVLATAIGNVGGLAIGANEARAVTRAREAREHERELERQNDRLESFASMLAHELRNPLNVAQIYLQQAVEGDREAADEVDAALDRIEEMIEILLVTARRAESEIDWQPVALSAVASDAWAGLSVGDATLVVETDRTVRADPVHLRHLLENLFRNAVEHGSTSNRPEDDDAAEHGADDVTVRIGDHPGVSASEASGGSTDESVGGFYVADDGPGIPDEERERVFEAGFTTDANGLGLGLTFVAQLAEAYGWECTLAESEAGGARFEFSNVEVVEPEEQQG